MKILKYFLVWTLLSLGALPLATAKETSISIDLAPIGEADPALASDFADSVINHNVYDILLADKKGGGIDYALAESYTVNKNIYTFALRKNITFNSGNPLTSADVVYSLERLLRINKGYSYFFNNIIDNVKALDPYTVQFTLKKESAVFLSSLKKLWIVDSQTVQSKPEGWLSRNSAGSGAYILKSHDPQTVTVFTKRDTYWAKSNPKAPDIARIYYGLKPPTVRAKLEKGEHTFSSLWLPPEVLSSLEKNKDILISQIRANGQMYVKLNTQRAPFDDINCRRGFVAAFNYKTALKMTSVGSVTSGVPSNGVLPKGLIGYDSSKPIFKQDLEKAKEYFAACKYDEIDIELYWTTEVPLLERFALLIHSELKKIGIKSHIVAIPWVKFQEVSAKAESTPHTTQIFVISETGDPDSLLKQQFYSPDLGKWSNTSWWSSPEVDSLLEAASIENDLEKREQLYLTINQKITDAAPTVVAYDMIFLLAMNKYVNLEQLEDPSRSYLTVDYNFRFIDIEVK